MNSVMIIHNNANQKTDSFNSRLSIYVGFSFLLLTSTILKILGSDSRMAEKRLPPRTVVHQTK